MAIAAAASTLIVALGAWRLLQGPVSLTFLTPYLLEGLSYAAPGFAAEVSDTVLRWVPEQRGLDVRAVNVRLRDAAGRRVLTAPEISFGISLAALLGGSITPSRIDIIGTDVRLIRGADGRLDFGLAEEGVADAPGGKDSGALTAAIMRTLADAGGPAHHLNRVSVLDANLTIDDRATRSLWRARHSDLVLRRDADGIRGDLLLNIELLGETSRVTATARIDESTGRMSLAAIVNNFRPARVPVEAAAARWRSIDAPLSGSVNVEIDAERRLTGLAFDMRAGAGMILAPELAETHVRVSGGELRGRLAANGAKVTVERAVLDLEGFVVKAQGEFGVGERQSIDLAGEFQALPVARLKALWPVGVADGAHVWIGENLAGGMVSRGTFRARLDHAALNGGALPADAVALDFEYADVQVHYLRPLPPLTDGHGKARMTVGSLVMDVAGARVGDIALSGGAVKLLNLGSDNEIADIEFTATGPTAVVLGLLDRQPLGFISRLDLKPADVGGDSRTRTRLAFPLLTDLKVDQITYSATAALTDAAVQRLFDRYNLTGGDLILTLESSGFDVAGQAAINGVPGKVSWRQDFRGGARYRLAAQPDDAGRAALGYPTEPYITGPTPGVVEVATDGKGKLRVSGEFTLDAAAMDVAELVWKKPPGKPGKLRFALAAGPGQPTRLEQFAIAAGDLQAEGRGVVSASAIEQLETSKLRFGDSQVGVKLNRRASGAYDLRVEGPSLKLGGIMHEGFRKRAGGATPDVFARARLDRANIADGVDLVGVNLEIDIAAARIARLHASGAFAEGGRLEGTVQPGQRRRVSIKSDNAGPVLRYLGIASVRGGRFTFTGEFADDQPNAPLLGDARIEDFKVADAPVLAQLLSLGSLTGINNLLSGEGLGFTRADVAIRLGPDELKLENGRAIGPAIGITGAGTLNRDTDEMNLQGTLVPAYTINTVLGNIPLIGKLLVGGEGEGVVGLNYSVTGAGDKRRVQVNPLSAFAPGILRRLFLFSAPSASDGETDPNPPPGQQAN
jgi:AsmA-like C-terminal region/Protein of unknown function